MDARQVVFESLIDEKKFTVPLPVAVCEGLEVLVGNSIGVVRFKLGTPER